MLISENEFKNIKKYISSPINIGLWETQFIIINPPNIHSLIKYINNSKKKYLNINQVNNIISILSTMYNLCSDTNHSHECQEIKSIIEDNKIFIQNDIITIDKEYFFITDFNNNTFKILSINKNVSLKLEDIMKKIGYAFLQSRKKVFSPKNILFAPYFFYTNIISKNIFSNYEALDYFNRGIGHYNTQQYEESMRMLSKAYEATLQIYMKLYLEKVHQIFVL